MFLSLFIYVVFCWQTKFTNHYKGNVLLPHKFSSGEPPRRILALSSEQSELDVAESMGACLFGGPELIIKVTISSLFNSFCSWFGRY